MPPDADRGDPPAPSESRLHYLAVLLATLAGLVDATGFLQLGGNFVSFMSGNSTHLAVSVTKVPKAALLTGSVIVAFVAGVVVGSLVSTAAPVRRKPLVLAATAFGLTCSALLQAFGWKVVAVIAMAVAMGCANNVFRAEDGPYVIGVTYMTGNVVKFAEALAAALTGKKRPWLPYLTLWLGLVIGAMIGAALFRAVGMNTLWFAAGAAALLAFVARNIKSPPMERVVVEPVSRAHSGEVR